MICVRLLQEREHDGGEDDTNQDTPRHHQGVNYRQHVVRFCDDVFVHRSPEVNKRSIYIPCRVKRQRLVPPDLGFAGIVMLARAWQTGQFVGVRTVVHGGLDVYEYWGLGIGLVPNNHPRKSPCNIPGNFSTGSAWLIDCHSCRFTHEHSANTRPNLKTGTQLFRNSCATTPQSHEQLKGFVYSNICFYIPNTARNTSSVWLSSDITWPEADHTPHGRFNWLTLKEEFLKRDVPAVEKSWYCQTVHVHVCKRTILVTRVYEHNPTLWYYLTLTSMICIIA